MYETLLPVTETYAKHKVLRAGVFEIGRTYHVKGDHKVYENYKEVRTLGIVFKDSSLSPKDNSKETRKLLAGLMKELGVESKSKRVGDKVKIFAGNTELGTLTYDAIELYTENLMQVSAQSKRVAYELPQYRTEDLSLIVPNDIELGELCDTITDLDKNVTDAQIIEEYTAKELEEGKKAVLIRITYINKLSKEAVLKDIKSKFKVTSR
jgi:phenylalanyl-tRNA synthetase beta subunit